MDSDPRPSALEGLLSELGQGVRPSPDAKKRVKMRFQAKLVQSKAVNALDSTRQILTPAAGVQSRIWSRIAVSMDVPSLISLWEKLRGTLTPTEAVRETLWNRVLGRLQPALVPALLSRPFKVVMAFALILAMVQVTPLFVAPHTIAEASITVIPQRGEVSVLIGGLWQPLKSELNLQKPSVLQTQDGEATIMLHDDAVLRLAPYTTLSVNDLADRPETSEITPMLSLREGDLWVMGVVPRHIEGIAIGTAEGRVVIHEGSIGLHQDGDTRVEVWHRSATIVRRGKQMQLMAGEQATLQRQRDPQVTKIAAERFDEPWVSRNLDNDAVHQSEIAQMQQERRAASAGILPDSQLYPAKRWVEAVDVFFSFSQESRARKIISQANTRLNEAAALLARGSGSEAQKPLQEYHDTLLAVASGSGGSAAVNSLLEKEVVVDALSDTSAALPDDSAYALKQTVRDTIAALPLSIEKPDTKSSELLDELSAVRQHVQEGEVQAAKAELEKLKPDLPGIEDEDPTLTTDLRQEVQATLSTVTESIASKDTAEALAQDAENSAEVDQRALRFKAPLVPSKAVIAPRTPEEITKEAQEIRNRIVNIYSTHQGRAMQFHLEAERLQGDPDRGAILRKLYILLPRKGLAEYVRTELIKVGEEMKEYVEEGTGSGEVK